MANRLLFSPFFATLVWVLPFLLALSSGCQNLVRRGQSPDPGTVLDVSEEENGKTKYIGPATNFSGFDYAKLQAIGLLVGLKGTGSDPGPSWQREKLIDELKLRKKIDDPQNLVASLDTCMVKVTAFYPPGIRKGDRVDLLVETFENDPVTSFNSGYLLGTSLRPYTVLGNRVKNGNSMGFAEGFVLEDSLFESRQDHSNLVRGVILGGGVASEDRVLLMNIKPEKQGLKTVADISYAINGRFTVVTGDGRVGVAKAKTDRVIELKIPDHYRENIGRFTQVLSNIAYGETASEKINRLEDLETMLAQPAQARLAALRLEAIGRESTSILKRALKNPDLEVRFNAAMALAYLDEADGIGVLQESALKERAFRWHALAGLQVLTDPRANQALLELMNAESAETRYGAFRALKTKAPNDPAVKGTLYCKDYYVHVVPTTGPSLLHLSRSKYPEIVLFNDTQTFSPDLMFLKSGLTVKGNGNGKIEVVRYVDGERFQKIVDPRVSEVIRALAELDCKYSTIMELVRTAKQKEWLDSKLAINALPKPGRDRLEGNDELADHEDSSSESGPEANVDTVSEFTQTRMLTEPENSPETSRKPSLFSKWSDSRTKNRKTP